MMRSKCEWSVIVVSVNNVAMFQGITKREADVLSMLHRQRWY